MIDKYSVRIGGRVTSFNIPKSFVALYVAVLCQNSARPRDYMLTRIDEIIGGWEGNNGKGLGEFVLTELCRDLIDVDDMRNFNEILKNEAEETA